MSVNRAVRFIPLVAAIVTLVIAPRAVGASSTPLPPDPLQPWGLAKPDSGSRLSQVIWTGKQFVAVGGNTVASSADGLHWTVASPPEFKHALWGIATNGKNFVAVGESGSILSSSDLKTWTDHSTDSANRYISAFWLGDKFLVLGDRGVNAASPDGETWTEGAAYGNFYFLHGTWTGNKIMVGALNTLLQSDDGTSFDKSMGNTGRMSDVAWGNDLFVAVGESKNGILTSPDGATWTKRNATVTSTLRGVCWTGNEFVAVGDAGVILASPDGTDWKRGDAGGLTANLTSVTGNGSVLVAVSETGSILSTNAPPGLASGPAGALSGDQLKALVIIKGDVSTGTGFIAKLHNQLFVVTNQHVLSGNSKFTVTGMDGTALPTNGALFGAVNADVAILKIPDDSAKYSLEVMDDPLNNAKAGTPVTVPGNSLGAGVTLQVNGKLLGIGPALVEVDAKFVPGNSGSPIIDRHTGQVIGIATMYIVYKPDVTKQYGLGSDTRWFGYRLDNINPNTGWQKLDWARFSAEGIKIKMMENLSKAMIAILTNQPTPVVTEASAKLAVSDFKAAYALAVQQQNKQALVGAYKQFGSKLHNIAMSNFQDPANQSLYPYHAQIFKQQEDLQTVLDAAFADVSKTVDALVNGNK
jgi:hypothetical protein